MKNKAIILLSGGLDCVVSLALVKEICSDILALTFNYGQKSFLAEKDSAEKIAQYYNIKHEIVELPWLAKISTSSLNNNLDVPKVDFEHLDEFINSKSNSNSVWVPNRNALFANIAATYAEALDYDSIIIGANKEEAVVFKDNSAEFINAINKSFENSLNTPVMLIAPLIDANKTDIVKIGLELKIPFHLIHSCYSSNDKHCEECESCVRLKRALIENNAYEIIDKIFN